MLNLNQAGTSWPKPKGLADLTANFLASDPIEWPRRFDAAHEEIAKAFGIGDRSRLLLTPGCTSALNVAITDIDWQAGDRVVHSAMEHHALHRPIVGLSRWGVEAVEIPRTTDRPFDLDRYTKVFTEEAAPPRLVAVCAASNVTGERLPIGEIRRIAHDHGSIVLIDAAQTIGWFDHNLPELGDLVAFGGHKGLQGLWGIGGLFVSPRVTLASPSASCEFDPTAPETVCSPMPGYCDVGSVDQMALESVRIGLRWLNHPDRADRFAKVCDLVNRFRDDLLERSDVTVLSDRPGDRNLPTVAFTVTGCDPGEIARRYREHGVIVSGGVQCAPLAHRNLGTDPAGVVRVSFGPRHITDDVERLREVSRRVCGSMKKG